jgi:hypothetical protein
MTGREFDPSHAGGPIRPLSTARLEVTGRGVDAVERHVGRFGEDRANRVMIGRLRRIARGEIEATDRDLNDYAHELREFVRYRQQGFPTGAGDDYELWNDAHSAALADYGLRELDAAGNRNLFHPEAWPFLPH